MSADVLLKQLDVPQEGKIRLCSLCGVFKHTEDHSLLHCPPYRLHLFSDDSEPVFALRVIARTFLRFHALTQTRSGVPTITAFAVGTTGMLGVVVRAAVAVIIAIDDLSDLKVARLHCCCANAGAGVGAPALLLQFRIQQGQGGSGPLPVPFHWSCCGAMTATAITIYIVGSSVHDTIIIIYIVLISLTIVLRIVLVAIAMATCLHLHL